MFLRVMTAVYAVGYFAMIAASGVSTWPRMGWFDWWEHMAFEIAWYAPLWPLWLAAGFLWRWLGH